MYNSESIPLVAAQNHNAFRNMRGSQCHYFVYRLMSVIICYVTILVKIIKINSYYYTSVFSSNWRDQSEMFTLLINVCGV